MPPEPTALPPHMQRLAAILRPIIRDYHAGNRDLPEPKEERTK